MAVHPDDDDAPESLSPCRSRPRLSRCRTTLPEEAWIGFAVSSADQDRSLRSRSAFSPAARSSLVAVSGPMPWAATSAGARAVVIRRRRWSRSVSSASGSAMRRARARRLSLVIALRSSRSAWPKPARQDRRHRRGRGGASGAHRRGDRQAQGPRRGGRSVPAAQDGASQRSQGPRPGATADPRPGHHRPDELRDQLRALPRRRRFVRRDPGAAVAEGQRRVRVPSYASRQGPELAGQAAGGTRAPRGVSPRLSVTS